MMRCSKFVFVHIATILMLAVLTSAGSAQTTITILASGAIVSDQLLEAVSMFENAHPDFVVDLVNGGGLDASGEKLMVMLVGGVAPDITIRVLTAYSDSIALDLGPYLERRKSGDWTIIDALFDDERVSYRGRILGLPFNVVTSTLLWNGRLFAEAGLPPEEGPETWNEVLTYGRKLTDWHDGEIVQYGLSGIFEAFSWNPALWSAGGRLFDETHQEFLVGPDYEPAIKAINFWRDLGQAEIMPPRGIGSGAFIQGTAAMNMHATHVIQNHAAAGDPFPLYAGITPSYDNGEPVPWVEADLINITQASRNPDAAWMFIDWIMQSDVQMELMRRHGGLWAMGGSPIQEVYDPSLLEEFPALQPMPRALSVGRRPSVPPGFPERDLYIRIMRPRQIGVLAGEIPTTTALIEMAQLGQVLLNDYWVNQ